jgi:hypothetical protein
MTWGGPGWGVDDRSQKARGAFRHPRTRCVESPLVRGEGFLAGSERGWTSHQECDVHGLSSGLYAATPVPVPVGCVNKCQTILGQSVDSRDGERPRERTCPAGNNFARVAPQGATTVSFLTQGCSGDCALSGRGRLAGEARMLAHTRDTGSRSPRGCRRPAGSRRRQSARIHRTGAGLPGEPARLRDGSRGAPAWGSGDTIDRWPGCVPSSSLPRIGTGNSLPHPCGVVTHRMG